MSETSPRASMSPYLFSGQKRTFDAIMGITLSTAGTPLEVTTGLLLRRVLDAGPMYLKQERASGIVYKKLRTMNQTAVGHETVPMRQSSALFDPRVSSKLARFVRKSRIDELPQLRQVVTEALFPPAEDVRPRASMVGVRPLLARHVHEMYDEVARDDPELADRWQTYQYHAPQGMVSPAATHFMHRTSNEEIDPAFWMELETYHVQHATFRNEVNLLADTGNRVVYQALDQAVTLLEEHMDAFYHRPLSV